MIGHILSGKALAAAILAGAVATGGAAAATAPTPSDSASHAGSAVQNEQQNGSADETGPTEQTGKGNGQGATISALAKSIPGGPGKGAQISAAARGHGQTVSAAARNNAGTSTMPRSPAKPATPATPSAQP